MPVSNGTGGNTWLTASQILGLHPTTTIPECKTSAHKKNTDKKSEAHELSGSTKEEQRDTRRDAVYVPDGKPSKPNAAVSRTKSGISVMSVGLIVGQDQGTRASTPTTDEMDQTFASFDGATTLARIPETNEQTTRLNQAASVTCRNADSRPTSPRPSFRTGDTRHFSVGDLERPHRPASAESKTGEDNDARTSTANDDSVEDDFLDVYIPSDFIVLPPNAQAPQDGSMQESIQLSSRVSSASSNSSETLVPIRQVQVAVQPSSPSLPFTADEYELLDATLSELDRQRGSPSMTSGSMSMHFSWAERNYVEDEVEEGDMTLEVHAAKQRKRTCGGWFPCVSRQ